MQGKDIREEPKGIVFLSKLLFTIYFDKEGAFGVSAYGFGGLS